MGMCMGETPLGVTGEARRESFILGFPDEPMAFGAESVELDWKVLPELELILKQLKEYKANRDAKLNSVVEECKHKWKWDCRIQCGTDYYTCEKCGIVKQEK